LQKPAYRPVLVGLQGLEEEEEAAAVLLVIPPPSMTANTLASPGDRKNR